MRYMYSLHLLISVNDYTVTVLKSEDYCLGLVLVLRPSALILVLRVTVLVLVLRS